MRSCILAAMLALPVPAMAATVTVTFDGAFFDENGETTYLNGEGFVAQTTTSRWDGESILLHDDGGIGTSMIVREDGAAFTPLSVDLTLISNYLRSGPGPMPGMDDIEAFLDWCDDGVPLLAGFRFTGLFADDTTTVLDIAASSAVDMTQMAFGAAFAGISALTAEIVYPAGLGLLPDIQPNIALIDAEGIVAANQDWCMEYCSAIRLDNLVVVAPSPVPLPATAFLLGAALLSLLRRRRA